MTPSRSIARGPAHDVDSEVGKREVLWQLKTRLAKFCLLSLKKAVENAHHDEPGFW